MTWYIVRNLAISKKNEDKRTLRSSYLFKVFLLLVSAVWAYIDSSTSCIDNHHTITILIIWEYNYFNLNCLVHTFIDPAGSPLWTEKCRLASPSVTNERREWPLALSGTSPASIAARRISLCCVPSHPFGCERTKSRWDLTEFHKSGPLAWVSWIKLDAHSKRYLRKSAITSTTVLLSGSGGMSLPTVRPAPTFDLRCSLNLGKGIWNVKTGHYWKVTIQLSPSSLLQLPHKCPLSLLQHPLL